MPPFIPPCEYLFRGRTFSHSRGGEPHEARRAECAVKTKMCLPREMWWWGRVRKISTVPHDSSRPCYAFDLKSLFRLSAGEIADLQFFYICVHSRKTGIHR